MAQVSPILYPPFLHSPTLIIPIPYPSQLNPPPSPHPPLPHFCVLLTPFPHTHHPTPLTSFTYPYTLLPHSCTSFPQSPSTHPHHSILISSSAHPYSCFPFPHPSTLVKPTPLFPLSPLFYPPTPHSHTFLLHSTILLSSLLPIFSQDLNILGNVFFTCTQKIKNHICNSERGL